MDMTADQARDGAVREIGSPAQILEDAAAYAEMAAMLQQGRVLIITEQPVRPKERASS